MHKDIVLIWGSAISHGNRNRTEACPGEENDGSCSMALRDGNQSSIGIFQEKT